MKPPLEWGLISSVSSIDVPNAISVADNEFGVPYFLYQNVDTFYLHGDIDFESK